MISKMKVNYETPFAELGYSEDYQRFLFDRLGLLGNMEEDFKDYKEQGFLHIEDYAVYKLSQTSVNDLINHMLDLIDVLEYEIEKLEQHQKQIIWNIMTLDNYGGGSKVRISKEMFEEAKKNRLERIMEYKYRDKQVKLHGIFQMSTVVPPSNMIGGHTGGVVAYPVAVIEYENGDLEQVSPNEIVGDYTHE